MFEPILIRFGIGQGVAGYVAETGESVNVEDFSSDERFNSDIDEEVLNKRIKTSNITNI